MRFRSLLLLAAISSLALAQDVPAPPSPAAVLASDAPPAPKPVVHTEMLDVAFGALTLVLGLLGRYLMGKSGESKVAATLATISEAIRAAVAEANVTLKPKLKTYLEDGKLSDEEALSLKNDVVALVQAKLPPGIIRSLVAIFGGFADTWIRGQVERAVIEQKAAEAAAKVVTPVDAAKVLA